MEFPGEREAARGCCRAGAEFGYGNLISRMRAAWALSLIGKWDMEVRTACLGAWMPREEAEGYGRMEREDAVEALKAYCFEEG